MLICVNTVVFGQNKRMQFKGKVLDRETRAAITGANITISGTRRGTSSNEAGEFSVIIYNLPVYMTVSHLGYETQRIWLDNPSAPFITVLMNPVSSLLPEVEIKAKNEPLPFFKDNKYAVLDYEVDSNMVYMLIYRLRLANSELLYKSVNGDTIARSGILPFKPTGLFLDCMHNLHVFSQDSAYQVRRENDHLNLFFPVDVNRFRSVLADCLTSTDSLLFFRKESADHQRVDFYTINRITKRKQHLSSVRDEGNLKMLHDNPRDYFYLMMDTIPGVLMDTIPDQGETAEWLWVTKILYKNNKSTLHRIDDLICIFNTADYTLGLYTLTGEFTSKLKMPVDQVNDGRWTTEIYIDNIGNKAYTSFRKGGLYSVYRIDLNTGELKRKLSAEHEFPQKIRVHNNFLFYLYDLPAEGDNKHLFRQKL
jgi:hypothetical protein